MASIPFVFLRISCMYIWYINHAKVYLGSFLNVSLLLIRVRSVWTSMGIYGTVLMLIAVGRAAFVFPLSALSNFMNRNATRAPSISFEHQVSFKLLLEIIMLLTCALMLCAIYYQIVIWWAGLMRGAVSIALAFKQVL